MMTDPISDMLTRLRNATQAHKETVDIPASKLKKHIADLLNREGFVGKVDQFETGKKSTIRVELKYDANKRGVIAGLRRISKPGLRVYKDKSELPRVLNGLGIAILSTSQGILTDGDCRKKGVGGEVLCYVW